jgi:hypothetical protein
MAAAWVASGGAVAVEACISTDSVCCRVEEFTPQGLALSMWALSGLEVGSACTGPPVCTH